jgi:hypothetical protein
MAAKAYRPLRAVPMTAAKDIRMIPRNPIRIRGAGDEHAEERPVLTVSQAFELADRVGLRPIGNVRKVKDGVYRLRFQRHGGIRTHPEICAPWDGQRLSVASDIFSTDELARQETQVEHLYHDLRNLKKGSTVVVTLRNQANVRLMTRSEYSNYKAGRRHRYHGGKVTKSPFRLVVPSNGHWVVAIDLGGYAGRISAGVAVEPPPRGFLPEARTARSNPLNDIAVREPEEPVGSILGGQTWDVFISHASEDKAAVARPLRAALISLGVSVWLDEAEMRIGHSLRRKIDEGIRSSRFGIVVLSKSFFGKGWTNHELDGLVTKNVAGEQSLLPIWHDLTADDVRSFSPSLADKVALSTQSRSIDEIAQQIADVVLADADTE